MSKPVPDMSWRHIAVLWLVALPASVLLLSFILGRRDAARRENATAVPVAEQDPVAGAAFEAGYELAVAWQSTGLARPTERELDEYALRLVDKAQIPDKKRGVFITKFKRGFAWGPK